jgi:MFS family permease
MSYGTASTAHPATDPASHSRSSADLSSTGKLAIRSAIIAFLFLSQVAYNIGDFPLSVDFICYASCAAYLLVSGYVALDFLSFSLFTGAAALAALRIPYSDSSTSWTSLLLLLALLVPFSFRMTDRYDLRSVQECIQDTFVSAATVIGLVAIIQIVVVNAVKTPFLTNIHFVLPDAIRGAGNYAYTREGTGLIKANGFFLRESATLSIVMALALMIEFYGKARLRILAIVGAGLICSFSGSGILALFAGFVLPRSIGRIPVFIASLIGLVAILFVLYIANIPYLDAWFDRLQEFTTPNTSGYARFVAPFAMVVHSFEEVASTWLGKGAGSYLREIMLLRVKYEVNDPTWAKLIYEYGVLGFILVSSIFVIRLYLSSARIEVCNFLLFIWLSGGLLLKPDFTLMVWLLTLVPKHSSRSSPVRRDTLRPAST